MKQVFPYFFILLLLSLGFFSYKQWFSLDSPVLYNFPIESSAPDKLEVLSVIDLKGIRSEIKIADAPYTFFIFASFTKGDPLEKPDLYTAIKKHHKVFEKNGIRLVYIWYSVEDNAKEAIRSIIDPNEKDSGYWLSMRMLKDYFEKYDIAISSFPFFMAYNQSGELILQADSLSSAELPSEILQIPVYDMNNFKRVIKSSFH